ncbi:uncharacterized protein BT62DRAFT_1011167 [Guyanagaster necrorhizus]|uniref:Uncharacterized protein n=1 Tax=Guyanagaster necrorhizus TaxID=856835 RepID=A0A9P7VL11_9AGAR|nr:uncharacterized protein BT62DRAFT_1011167 [Guyanagaster necrorhizus MCA 3950]KAG7441854.1 hypothetical protein BT62DRAFT_1011167 [Guyanagaster necrorhizus MCA 3950]
MESHLPTPYQPRSSTILEFTFAVLQSVGAGRKECIIVYGLLFYLLIVRPLVSPCMVVSCLKDTIDDIHMLFDEHREVLITEELKLAEENLEAWQRVSVASPRSLLMYASKTKDTWKKAHNYHKNADELKTRMQNTSDSLPNVEELFDTSTQAHLSSGAGISVRDASQGSTKQLKAGNARTLATAPLIDILNRIKRSEICRVLHIEWNPECGHSAVAPAKKLTERRHDIVMNERHVPSGSLEGTEVPRHWMGIAPAVFCLRVYTSGRKTLAIIINLMLSFVLQLRVPSHL